LGIRRFKTLEAREIKASSVTDRTWHAFSQ